MILRLTSAELSEVLCRLGDDICEELELDSAEWLPYTETSSFSFFPHHPIQIAHGSF